MSSKQQPKNDVFDLDGSGEDEQGFLNWMIREVYRVLWDWKDLLPGKEPTEFFRRKVSRYAGSCYDNGALMGPETMNSFRTTYSAAKDTKDAELLKLMRCSAKLTGCMGNMTLTYKGYNRYVRLDYWDCKLHKQYPSEKLAGYVNTFFLWDYVHATDNNLSRSSRFRIRPFKKHTIPRRMTDTHAS